VETESDREVAITARGIRMSGPWGPVYGPLDLDVAEGGLTVLNCPAGSGRTTLLMTLAGRMRPVGGTLSVFGLTRARDVFGVSALAGIDELDTVPEAVTVADLVTEELRWNAPWYRLVRRAGAADLARVCAAVFGELPLPSPDRFVDELSELDAVLLRVALANVRTPRLLVVGSLDAVAENGDRDRLLERLIALGARQTVVTSTVNPLPPGPYDQLVVALRTELADHQKGAR
jgi:ABC-type multidrug transport system ATPase subunit